MITKPAPSLPPPSAAAVATATATAVAPPPLKPRLTPLPDPPRDPDMVTQSPHISRAELILGARYRYRRDVVVCRDGYLCYDAGDVLRAPHPDCLVAFGLTTITPEEVIDANGYNISQIGKPPEFVLEVASESTGRRDYTEKREIYAGLKVVEYWRFDRTGGRFHDAPLAGDRLTADGTYEPIPVYEHPDGTFRGYSAVLGLELHWVAGWLRFWDPATEEYLPDLDESMEQTAAARAERDAEAAARQQAEARAAHLEAQLQQLQAQAQRQAQSPPEPQ